MHNGNWFAVSRTMFDHCVVGAAQPVKPADRRQGSFSRMEAWLWLTAAPFAGAVIPGEGRAPITLELADNGAEIPNVAGLWRWRPADARAWLTAVCEAHLITEPLHAEMLARIAQSKREQRQQIPSARRSAVLAKTSGKCVYCGVALVLTKGRPNSYQADHVLAVALGGSDDIANLVPSCADCNAKKRAKTALQFLGGAPCLR